LIKDDSSIRRHLLNFSKLTLRASDNGFKFNHTFLCAFELEGSLFFRISTLAKNRKLCKISLLHLGCPPHPGWGIFIWQVFFVWFAPRFLYALGGGKGNHYQRAKQKDSQMDFSPDILTLFLRK
jgi:hypothetical protein